MQWLSAKIHPTWHATWLFFGVVAGAALAQLWRWDVMTLVFFGVLGGFFAFARPRRLMVLVAFFAGVSLGLARGSVGQQALAVYQPLRSQHVRITGVVSDDVDAAKFGATRMKLTQVRYDGHDLPGRVFVSATKASAVRRSDRVSVDGILDEGFGSFPASIKGEVVSAYRPVPGDVALEVRDGFAAKVKQAIPEPEASLGVGYLLGAKSALPTHLSDALRIAGLTHIVVASGYNLMILVRIGRRLFAKISKYLATLSGAVLIVGFIAMTGMSATMMRAGLVAGMGLWAWYVGRKFHPVTLLGLAAMITVLIDPSFALGDLGWLLSFSAFAGVMIIAPIVTSYFFGGDRVPFVGGLLIETLSAIVATTPVMIMAFGQFSVVAPIANVLVVPMIPITMLLVAVAGMGTLVLPAFASVWGWPAAQLLKLQTTIVEWCASPDWAMSKPQWQWWMLVLYLAAAGGVIGYMKWRSGVRLYQASVVE